MHELEMTLFHNSIDFLNESLSKAINAQLNIKEWKYAVLSIITSIELVIKSRLYKEHPAFIFKEIDKQKETISLRGGIERLNKLCGNIINEKDKKILDKAIIWRNEILHHEFKLNIDAVKVGFTDIVGFVSEFYQKQFHKDFQRLILDKKILKNFLDLKEYTIEIRNRIKDRFKDEKIPNDSIIYCITCGHDTYVVNSDKNICYMCGSKNLVERCNDCGRYFCNSLGYFMNSSQGIEIFVCQDCIES